MNKSLLNTVFREMPVFKAPVYSKVVNSSTGTSDPSYLFAIQFPNDSKDADECMIVADSSEDISLEALQGIVLERVSWWNQFIDTFLQSSTKFFSKPYTVQHIHRITKHTLKGVIPETFPVNVRFMPSSIQIMSGTFYVHWEYHTTPIVIDIPVLEESSEHTNKLPDSIKLDDMEEHNMDELPEDKTTDNSVSLMNPTKIYDKQRIKELRLKVKLAAYRAQYYYDKYRERYDSELSDFESDTENDTDTENEFSEEEVEVQL